MIEGQVPWPPFFCQCYQTGYGQCCWTFTSQNAHQNHTRPWPPASESYFLLSSSKSLRNITLSPFIPRKERRDRGWVTGCQMSHIVCSFSWSMGRDKESHFLRWIACCYDHILQTLLRGRGGVLCGWRNNWLYSYIGLPFFCISAAGHWQTSMWFFSSGSFPARVIIHRSIERNVT